jgi:hypothetical protein
VSPKLITRPNIIVSDKFFALERDVDDHADDVGCVAQLITRPNTIVSDKFVTWMVVPVMLVVPPKLINRPNTIVPSTFVHWSAIVLMM